MQVLLEMFIDNIKNEADTAGIKAIALPCINPNISVVKIHYKLKTSL
jgi:hypothetical protein